jgi:hypothetical protein
MRQCAFCDNDHCESIPYPRGKRWICQKCGEEHYDMDAAIYREQQRKRLHELLQQIGDAETEQ